MIHATAPIRASSPLHAQRTASSHEIKVKHAASTHAVHAVQLGTTYPQTTPFGTAYPFPQFGTPYAFPPFGVSYPAPPFGRTYPSAPAPESVTNPSPVPSDQPQ